MTYNTPELKNLDPEQVAPTVISIVRGRDISKAKELSSVSDIEKAMEILGSYNEKLFLRDLYTQLLSLEASNGSSVNRDRLARCLIEFLPNAPYLTDLFLQSSTWKRQRENLDSVFGLVAPALLKELSRTAHAMPGFIQRPFTLLLQELSHMSIQSLAIVVETIALSVHEPETALDLLLETIEPETIRLLAQQADVTRQCIKSFIGVALDHVDEASQNNKTVGETLQLARDGENKGSEVVKTSIRVDSPLSKVLRTGDHVRLITSRPPENAPLSKPYQIDALVMSANFGTARFRCIHRPPSYLQDCAWALVHCGSFVTTKTMIDALETFYGEKSSSLCFIKPLICLDFTSELAHINESLPYTAHSSLNSSQNSALEAAMRSPLTLLWGPPGTGKTHTIVVILMQLLAALPGKRLLVAAPTHNAVDNILQKLLKEGGIAATGEMPLRVSTSVGSPTHA